MIFCWIGFIKGIWSYNLDKVYSFFPPETVKFLKREADRFEIPLAYRLEEGLKTLLSALLEKELVWERIDYSLDRIIKLEVLQTSRPSEGLAFIYYLKSALREVVGEELIKQYGPEALLEVEDRIDMVALRAFNHFMDNREKLNELKFQEWKSRLFLLLKRSGYLYDFREGSPSERALK